MTRLFQFISSKEFVLALFLTLSFVGLTFPFRVPLFTPLILLYFVIFFFKKAIGKITIPKLHEGLALFYFCTILYLFSLLFNNGIIYDENISDLQGILPLVAFTFLIGTIKEAQFKRALALFHILIIPAVSLVAALSLFNYYQLLMGGKLLFINDPEGIAKNLGVSLFVTNYNMLALGMFAGFLSSFSALKERSMILRIMGIFGLLLTVPSIVLSGSRRSILFLIFIILFFSVRYISDIINRVLPNFATFHIKKRWIFPISMVLLFVFLFLTITLSFPSSKIVDLFKFERIFNRYKTMVSEGQGLQSFSSRTDRWIFSLSLLNNYNIEQVIFGSGFGYLGALGANLGAEENTGGSPHNFFISAMLYSGLIGLTAVVLLISLTMVKVIWYKKLFTEEFMFLYFITFLNALIGTNSIFSLRVFPLLIVTILMVKLDSSFVKIATLKGQNQQSSPT